MHLAPAIRAADLGPKTAALTLTAAGGRPVALVNRTAFTDPVIRDQAARALLAAGFDAERVMDALLPPNAATP